MIQGDLWSLGLRLKAIWGKFNRLRVRLVYIGKKMYKISNYLSPSLSLLR